MPGDTPSAADVDSAIEGILAPLREQIARVDREIAVLDERKYELMEVRKKLNRILGANAPRAKPGPRAAGASPRRSYTGVAEEKLAAVDAFVRAKYNGTEFTRVMLSEDKEFVAKVGMPPSATTKALSILHERGALRLVRQGGLGQAKGNRIKVWEVTKRA